MLVGGTLALTTDLLYRFAYHREEDWRFLKPTTGGQLCWVPVWAVGACWVLIGAGEVVSGGSR
jgi:hypothetical protein